MGKNNQPYFYGMLFGHSVSLAATIVVMFVFPISFFSFFFSFFFLFSLFFCRTGYLFIFFFIRDEIVGCEFKREHVGYGMNYASFLGAFEVIILLFAFVFLFF